MSAGMLGKIVGTIAVVGALAGTMAVGDAVNFNNIFRKTSSQVFPQNYKVEQGFYQEPYELSIDIEKNQSGLVEVYLASPNGKYPIREGTKDLIVGSIDDIAENLSAQEQKEVFLKFKGTTQDEIIKEYVKEKV
ncbi:MAG: hypothetical protein QXZ40_02140, partial [Candidatus Micrarchaeia archaeon]